MAEEPEYDEVIAWIVKAWGELGTCRQIGMAVGPIPWTAIEKWCEFHEFDRAEAMQIMWIIAKLDSDRAEAEAAKRRLEALGAGRGSA